jgi:hypothetical protein
MNKVDFINGLKSVFNKQWQFIPRKMPHEAAKIVKAKTKAIKHS